MAKYLLDTNVVTTHKVKRLPAGQFFSAVVLSELMTGAEPDEYKYYGTLWRKSVQEDTLVVPNPEDWLPATRILHLLARNRKSKAGGKSPRRSPTAKQELAMDVLIAVSAAREGVTVITNDTDFEAIRYYLKKLRIKTTAEFFT